MTSNDVLSPKEYLTYHKIVFRIAFDFLNEHFPPQNDPEWWKQFAIDTSEASEKANGGKLANGILVAIGDYLEEEMKKRREDSG